MYDNLQERIESFGWDCRTIDGHDMEEIRETLNSIDDKPLCIIMDTIKGKVFHLWRTQVGIVKFQQMMNINKL